MFNLPMHGSYMKQYIVSVQFVAAETSEMLVIEGFKRYYGAEIVSLLRGSHRT
jgi:hypothetical protein